MATKRVDHRTGGVALVVGYGLLVAVLFRNPADGLATATASVQGALFFVLLPVLGLASGVYTLLDWPLRTLAAFGTGTYLAVVGVGILLLLVGGATVTVLLGFVLFGLAVVALVGTLRSSVAAMFPGRGFDNSIDNDDGENPIDDDDGAD